MLFSQYEQDGCRQLLSVSTWLLGLVYCHSVIGSIPVNIYSHCSSALFCIVFENQQVILIFHVCV